MSAPRNTTQRDKDRATLRRRGGNCGICGEPIDYTLPWPDPRCFVADHIKPLHKGGPDHIGNKQAAHNECNSTKRARDFAPIVRRSGSLD